MRIKQTFKAVAAFMAIACAVPAWGAATDSDARQWSDGPLTWNDFAGVPNQLNTPSMISLELTTSSTVSRGETKSKDRYSIMANAVMHRNQSFADATRCTKQRLRYHQVQFDLLEVMRRRLQSDINTGISGLETERRLKEYRATFTRRIAELDESTDYGRNETRLQDWEYDVRRQLEEMGVPPVPRVTPNSFCYGIYGGVGAIFPTGALTDQFKGSAIFMLGITGGYNNLRMKADISYGQPSFARNNMFNKKTADGKDAQVNSNASATYLGVGVQLGYCVLNTRRVAITPNVGGYYSSYGWTLNNLEWSKDKDGNDVSKITSDEKIKFYSFNWMASIDFDIKLHAHLSNAPLLGVGQREQFVSSLRISPFVARAAHDKITPVAKGYMVGFTVTYSGLARSLNF